MDYLKLTKEKLDVNTISDLVADEQCGAISLFVGTTRDSFEDKKVLTLEYEAYEPMAQKTMSKICDELRTKWPNLKHIAIYHRLGSVPVKEASVVIAISSPHRQDSLSSVQYAIDELKKSVPIWKKEQYENGDAEWKENKECQWKKSDNCPSEKNRFKRPKLNFETCTLENVSVPKNFIQISADEVELSRRMQCFIERKREENDLNNVLDFTNKTMENETDEETCARVNSIVIKQKDSKGHLKVQRVNNVIGPQMKTEYTNTLDKLMDSGPLKRKIKPKKENTKDLPVGIAERIESAEKCLQITGNNSKEIYERLKALENRLLYLETVSPEYYHFLNGKTTLDTKHTAKKTYTVIDLDDEIEKLKVKLEKDPKKSEV